MKKVVPMLLVLFFALPVIKGLAFTGGYFDTNKPLPIVNDEIKKMYDNNLTTIGFVRGYGTVTIVSDLPESVEVVEYYYHGAKANGLSLNFYDTTNKLIKSIVTSVLMDGWQTVLPSMKDVKSIKIINNGSGDYGVAEFDIKVVSVNEDISNITEKHTHNSATFSWVNPSPTSYTGVKIKQKGVEIANLVNGENEFTVKNLSPNTRYDFELITTHSNGSESKAVPMIVTTSELVDAGEISVLTANATHKRVDLSWKLPESEKFKNVIIYRDVVSKSLFDKLMGVSTVKAATPIFETNGTYFNDLTVQAETKYKYTLTTLSVDKVESSGVSVMVETLKNPKPEIGGGGYDKDPDSGDYTYYWAEPTTGKVKVMVGGKLFNTVLASTGKIVIPSADMKYSILGNPDVQLIPVDEDGNEGKPVKPPLIGGGGDGGLGGVDSLPFEVNELMKTVFSLLLLLSGIILVALAIELTPRLVKIIKTSIAQKGAVK